jgi:ankyrin repeat protein
LIKHNVDINLSGGWLDVTPIYYACLNGHTDVVQILLDNNCDIPDDVINEACKGGYKDIVEILIKHNVDITLSGGWLDGTPIYFACLNGHTVNVNIMFYQNFNNVFITSFTGSIYSTTRNVTIIVKQNLYNICMQILLDNNCDIPDGAINVVCKGGYKDIVEILIKHNVDINFSSGGLDGTPIYSACLKGHTDIVQMFHRLH